MVFASRLKGIRGLSCAQRFSEYDRLCLAATYIWRSLSDIKSLLSPSLRPLLAFFSNCLAFVQEITGITVFKMCGRKFWMPKALLDYEYIE